MKRQIISLSIVSIAFGTAEMRRISRALGSFVAFAQMSAFIHVHNRRNSPEAKLDREIYVPFVLNEHSHLKVAYYSFDGE